jgi:hypothetical protein
MSVSQVHEDLFNALRPVPWEPATNGNYRSVDHNVDHFISSINHPLVVLLCSIATIRMSAKFGISKGKFYQGRIWLQQGYLVLGLLSV